MMQGKRVLITGANSGIGKEAAVALAAQGAQIVMLCRSRQRAEAAQAEIIERSGNDKLEIVLADFASLASVAEAAETIKQRYDRIDVLLNNAAGNFISPTERLSAHAFDTIIDIVLKGSKNCTLAFGKHWSTANRKVP